MHLTNDEDKKEEMEIDQNAEDPNFEELEQTGQVICGPGAKKDLGLNDSKKLSSSQKIAIEKAKKNLMEQSIKTILLKQTITHKQTQAVNIQNNIQRQQAITLMCRVYIGAINFEIKEETIREAFSPFGPMRTMSMPYDHVGNHHKGFAFIEYETPEAAAICIDQMNGIVIQGYTLKVGRPTNMPQAQLIIDTIMEESKKFKRIYVAGIHQDLSEQDIRTVFEAFGRIVSCELYYDHTGKHKGYGFIDFEMEQSVVDAVSGMNLFDLGGKHLRVGRAVTPPIPLNSTTPSSSTLPTASAIAAAAITAKIAAIEAVSNTKKEGEVEPNETKSPLPQSQQPTAPPASRLSSGRKSKFGGFSEGPSDPAAIAPPSVFIPPASLTSNATPKLAAAAAAAAIKSAKPVEKDVAQQVLLDMPDMQTIEQQENIHIKGHQARQLLMQKLMRGNEDLLAQPSKVMLLLNMVDEVDEDLEDEVKEECGKYGAVSKVVIHQEDGESGNLVVKIFVEFLDHKDTEKAISAFEGRFFAGNVIKAATYDQQRFNNRDFA